jgi:hypothetical protein
MARKNSTVAEAPFFNVAQARWVIGVLGMLIAVVGKDSLLGLLLGQACSEIHSILRDERPRAAVERVARYKNN